MDESLNIPAPETRKRRRRRRREQQTPLQARLLLDDRAKGYVGLLSADLALDLFGDVEAGSTLHIGLAPWQPSSASLAGDIAWTVVPVQITESEQLPRSTLRFPTNSLALQSLKAGLSGDPRAKGGVEILVLDVAPVVLDTVFIRVDGDALRKHEDIQRRFGGGFQSQANGSISKSKPRALDSGGTGGSARPQSPQISIEDDLRQATRAALASPTIVHRADLFSIPLPAHPITHVPFPPVEVVLCEPVDQGVVSGDTEIIIDVDSRGKRAIQHAMRSQRTVSIHEDVVTDSSEDTSGEQFFSAAENDALPERTGAEPPPDTATETETEEETDDDDDNAISLSQPALPPQASGVLSSMTSATPRPFGARTNGIASPGSVFSGYTARTARGTLPAKDFDVKPLIKKIPDSILHPSPPSDDDDESRVYVDVKLLVRIGCFSGDWVKLTVTPSADARENFFPLGAFGDDESDEITRAVKVYGIPDISANEAMQRRKAGSIRRSSIGSAFAFARPNPGAYMPPVLFNNLGKPSSISLTPLSLQAGESRVVRSKVPASAAPPAARELTLLRLMTPFATERAASGGILASLKHHFSRRRRILQTGDLVAVAVDASSSRIMADVSSGQNGEVDLEELFLASGDGLSSSADIEVAWFKVGPIAKQTAEDSQSVYDSSIWADAASIDPEVTRLSTNGSEQAAVPVPSEVPWDFYFGARAQPRQLVGVPAAAVESTTSISKVHISPLRRRLRELLAVTTSPKAKAMKLPPIVVLLHSTQRGVGKRTLVKNAATDLGLHIFPIGAYDLLSDAGGGADVKTEATLRHRIERALQCGDMFTVPIIQHVEALTADRTAAAVRELLEQLRVLVLTTTELDNVSDDLRALVTHELEVMAPDEAEREGILTSIVQGGNVRLAPDVELKSVAMKTAALVAGDLVDVLDRASVIRDNRLENLVSSAAKSQSTSALLVRDVLVAGGSFARCLIKADLDAAVEAARKDFADAIGAPKIPNVTWDDVGGLSHVKDAVMETIQLPLERPELFGKGMKKRSGILFYGPPGTGKTLLAKAIATELSLNFFSVKGPELLNMYIGESEANVRRVFQRARDARPCVVFFDELDSVAPKRGNQGDSGGVMDRIVSQLLAELDGMSGGEGGSGSADVFVIGATNRPDLLDQALLRPGRFDKMLYLGIADTHEAQLTILEALTRKFTLDPALSLRNVAERLPLLYTGADMYALCSDAMLKAITRKADAVDRRIKSLPGGPVSAAYFFDHLASKEDIDVVVTDADFAAAQRELVGSVSAKELEHYQRIRAQFEAPPDDSKKKRQQQRAPEHELTDTSATKSFGASDRLSPPHATRSRGKDKGKGIKGKAAEKTAPSKDKAARNDNDDGDEDEDDDAYVTSNDFATANGSAGAKGKGSQDGGFGDAAEDDDDELYG